MAAIYFQRYFFCALFFIFTTSISLAATVNVANNPYLAKLVQLAEEKNLQQRPEWHKLLHYKSGFIPGTYISQVDAPRFFLAKNGKRNPGAELNATLAAFFEPFPQDRDAQHLHPQCIFVARYQWLKHELNFDSSQLPEHTCWRFNEWMDALNPKGVTLIFPSAYINNPASMFGHTLIRIDSHTQTEETKLLSYAINFGADTGNDGGLAYAFKGLLGGYPGSFSVQPYYLKVREYSDMENRDIWEYHLDLSEVETHTMLLHAWELRGIWFDYFFFDENCSYHLLSLLETARPELELTDQFSFWVIPSDTVRVLKNVGLTNQVSYRPSRHAVLQYRMRDLSDSEITAVQQLADGQLSPDDGQIMRMPLAQRAETLELAHEYADYHQDENQQQLYRLLQARSQLSITSPKVDVPAGIRPEDGHGTGRSSLIVGNEDHTAYQELQLRPAYHDLLDPAPGYADGAQIAFFNLAIRHNSSTDSTRLQSFTPVDIISLTPVSDISTPVSWQFDFGLRRKHGQRHTGMLSSINGGAGLSWSTIAKSTTYALFNLGVDVSQKELRKGYAAGTGISAGILADINANWRLNLFASTADYHAGDRHTEKTLGLEQRFSLNKENTIRLRWSRQRQLTDDFTNINVSWQHFF